MQRRHSHRASTLLLMGVVAAAPLLTGADGCDLTIIGQVQPVESSDGSVQDAGVADAQIDAPFDPGDPGADPCGEGCDPGTPAPNDAGVGDGWNDPRCAADYDAGQNGYPATPDAGATRQDAGTSPCDPAICGMLPEQPCADPASAWAADCVPDEATGICAWHVECDNPTTVTCQSDAECQPSEFCEVDCNQGPNFLGTCMPRPTTCVLGSRMACGCDGQTYESECMAHANGVSVAYPGCCGP